MWSKTWPYSSPQRINLDCEAVGEMGAPMWGGSRAGAGVSLANAGGSGGLPQLRDGGRQAGGCGQSRPVDSRGCGLCSANHFGEIPNVADCRDCGVCHQRGVQAYQMTPATMIEKSTPARNFHMVLSPLALTSGRRVRVRRLVAGREVLPCALCRVEGLWLAGTDSRVCG